MYAKPLRELSADDLGFYAHKAMTTWGNVNDFKHFLPRLLELLHLDCNNNWFDLHAITVKLQYGNWHQWPQNEQEAIGQFIFADWQHLVNETDWEVSLEDFNEYGYYIGLAALITAWQYSHRKRGLKNFVRFAYNYGSSIFSSRKAILIGNQDHTTALKEWLRERSLAETLEQAFFELQEEASVFVEELSIVQ